MLMETCVIGVDFGTDSVRALLVNAATGEELSSSVAEYERWKNGLYCDAAKKQFRQHPLDYIDGLKAVLKDVLRHKPSAASVKAIAVDTTGSTPCLIDKNARPLALTEKYKDDPDAMFILWKDHTATTEAEEINMRVAEWNVDYTKYLGRSYSSEWLWSKALHVLRNNPKLRADAYSVVEHCDWIPALLTGVQCPEDLKISRCSAGHKAMWADDWGGFPSAAFFSNLDNQLADFVDRMQSETYTCDVAAGYLSEEWAKELGLTTDVLVGIGNTDAHCGAVGAGIKYKTLVQNMGTSTCGMVVMPSEAVGDNLVEGICGQVDGSIIPGMIGFEAGMSAFGDVYAWFKKTVTSTTFSIIDESTILSDEQKVALKKEIEGRILSVLTEKAVARNGFDNSVCATDWLNGRRNPYTNYDLKSSIIGLTLSTLPEDIYSALVEATCFGIKSIVDHFIANGVAIEGIVAIGGVALKSPFVMQTLSNILNMSIKVLDCKEACALGAAMFAATIIGKYETVTEAQERFSRPVLAVYNPNPTKIEKYKIKYSIYKEMEFYGDNNLQLQ